MAESLETHIAALDENPEDWENRIHVAQAQYEAEDFEAASKTILGAPELPGDEENVVFAATIIGAFDLDQAHTILDSFLASESSADACNLKADLYEAASDDVNAAIYRTAAETGKAPAVEVASAPEGAVSLSASDVEQAEGEELVAMGDGGERALILAEGEAIHAAAKESDSGNKVSAIAVALLVHVVIGLVCWKMVLEAKRPQPPAITASVMSNATDDSLTNETVTKVQQRTAAAAASAQPVIAAAAFSDIAMPDIVDVSQDLAMVSMASGDAGFGMSMSGFGDVSNMGAIPAGMRSRCSMSERMQRLRESGGEDRAEKAVRNALTWLSKSQNPDGSFGVKYHCAMTGLSLLAYLGHCETPESPKFGDSVVKAAMYLMKTAKASDKHVITVGGAGNHSAYEHAIATYALAELYTMTKESGKAVPGLESILNKAVGVIVKGQTDLGGWDYGFRLSKSSDMSVSGWQIQALKAAHSTGRKFRGVDKALDASMEYLRKIQDGEGAFKYRPDNAQGKVSLTGAALLAMQVWGDKGSASYDKGMSYLSTKVQNNPPLGSNFYQPYYNTQAFFLHEGDEWETYNKNFQSRLLDAQNADGSWTGPNVGGHGSEDSHTMNTAWGCLMLEVYYRYLPSTAKAKDLKAK